MKKIWCGKSRVRLPLTSKFLLFSFFLFQSLFSRIFGIFTHGRSKSPIQFPRDNCTVYTWPWDRSWLLLTPCVFVYCFKLWPASHLSRQKCTRRILPRPSPGTTLLKIKGLHTAWKICYSFIYNIIDKRLDHCRLHPKLELEIEPGPPRRKRAIQTAC
jgi:hypothetical protein